MYLKRLEIQGFKSFADPLKLDFSKEITAVVGPNGSGKSNIADALRWVLGEQSPKTLRGAKMEDVIFSGTQNRKPLGFAEVSIVLDNSEGKIPIAFDEVRITRRVYRSGENEYFINKSSCRLKDIHQLFMDTGVGKEGYSIIGQGQIDRILSTKPEDRRFLFEEAVGIVKYKHRKLEAEKKLEQEKQNLIRVEDIISELDKQLGPLASQAEKARVYLELKEKVKKLELNLFIYEADNQKKELDSLEEMFLNNQEELSRQKEIQLKDKENYTALKRELEDIENNIYDNQNSISDIRANIEKTEGNNKVLEQQIEHYILDIKRLNNESEELDKRIEGLSQEKIELSAKFNALSLELKTKEKLLQEEENHFNGLIHFLLTGESEIENYKSDIIEKMNESSELKTLIQKIDSEIQYIEERKKQILSEKELLDRQYREQSVHLKAIKKLEETLKEERKKLNQKINELISINNQFIADVQKESTALNDLKEEMHSIKSRKDVLELMENEYEGFNKSVKSLMRLKKDKPNQLKGICGVVAGLIEVPKGYETAIDLALGNSLQNIVTETEEDAKDAIDYLKQNNLGRATFLPLSAIRGKSLGADEQKILNEQGVLGIASSIVHYDELYKDVISYLLGRVIIVDNLNHAIWIAKKYQHKYKIVTIDGEVLNPGGAMTGGSIQQKSMNIFLRSRELQELKEKLIKLTEEIKNREERIRAYEDKKNQNLAKIEDLKSKIQELDINILSNQHEIDKCEEMLNQLKDKESQLNLEEEQINIQHKENTNSLFEKREEMSRIENEIKAIQSKIEMNQSKLEKEKEAKDILTDKITKLKIEISSLEQKRDYILENKKRLDSEIEKQKAEKKQREEEIQGILKDKALKENEVNENVREIEKLRQTLIEKTGQQERFQEVKKEKLAVYKALEEKIEESSKTIELLQTEMNRLENKKTKLKLEQEVLYNKIWEEYEETYHSALKYKSTELSISDMKKLLAKHKNEMKDLGNVNINAIEEYEKVKERYDFLTAQREDILMAEKKLFGIIKELTASMEKQFIQNFATISANFNQVFTELFAGGKAYLKLTDEENILESGIEIIAQPPGKKLQNMMLLSGGEKALTAIALLFSILKMKPSPFCVLDEIEASLDDANVMRFASYLKKFRDSTQFIIITHRKGTMEVADTLYGVTMEEQGISKLLSVKLSDIEENEEAS